MEDNQNQSRFLSPTRGMTKITNNGCMILRFDYDGVVFRLFWINGTCNRATNFRSLWNGRCVKATLCFAFVRLHINKSPTREVGELELRGTL